MTSQIQAKNAVSLIEEILDDLDNAEKSLKSARNWNVLDIFGGGMIVDLIKHSKIGKASNIMEAVNYKMQRLSSIINGMGTSADFRMKVGSFTTFADFVFDGVLMDSYMISKILGSIDGIRNLRKKLMELRHKLAPFI